MSVAFLVLCVSARFALASSGAAMREQVRSSRRGWHDLFAGVVLGVSGDGPNTGAQLTHLELPIQKTGPWFTVEVSIAKQNVRLVVDTGSAKLWVRGSSPAGQMRGSSQNLSVFAPANFLGKQSLRNFSARYGRGNVAGETQQVLVGLGDMQPHLCEVGLATRESDFWAAQHAIDGMLGLGCGSGLQSGAGSAASSDSSSGADASEVPDNEPAEALTCVLPQAGLQSDHHVFSLRLGPTEGSLMLGYIPQDFFGTLTYMPPVEDCGHWSIPLKSLSVSGNEVWSVFDNAEAIIDSGTDGIVGPTFAVIALARALGAEPGKPGDGSGGLVTFYTVPCEAQVTSLLLRLGRKDDSSLNVTLTSEHLVHNPNLGDASPDTPSDCRLRLAGWDTKSWILGAVFFEAVQGVVFDPTNRQIAVASRP